MLPVMTIELTFVSLKSVDLVADGDSPAESIVLEYETAKMTYFEYDCNGSVKGTQTATWKAK